MKSYLDFRNVIINALVSIKCFAPDKAVELSANESDEVIVFGNEYPITQFANDSETIPYEILTSMSRRVKRVYYQE